MPANWHPYKKRNKTQNASPNGLIVMYCASPPHTRVRMWSDTGDSEPRRLVG